MNCIFVQPPRSSSAHASSAVCIVCMACLGAGRRGPAPGRPLVTRARCALIGVGSSAAGSPCNPSAGCVPGYVLQPRSLAFLRYSAISGMAFSNAAAGRSSGTKVERSPAATSRRADGVSTRGAVVCPGGECSRPIAAPAASAAMADMYPILMYSPR